MSTLIEILGNSQYWGLTLSIAAYLFACWLKQKTKLAFLNPILVSVIVIIAFLLGVGIDYDTYNNSNVLQINQYFSLAYHCLKFL